MLVVAIGTVELFLVEGFVPAGEGAEAGAEWGGGFEAKVALQGGGVGVGDGDVAGLHGHKFFVGLEVVVGGKDAGGNELFLEDLDEVQEVLGGAVADVVEGVGGYGEAVFAGGALGGGGHHTDHAFHNVVDIGEVALAVAVVEDFDGFAFQQLVGEAEVGHVGAAGGTVDGEEAQACGGDVVEFGIGVGHQLVALLGGGIEADGIVDFVVCGIRHFFVGAVDRGAGGVDEMFHSFRSVVVGMAAGLNYVVEADEVGLHVGIGVGDGIADAGLGVKVDDYLGAEFAEEAVDEGFIGDVAPDECPCAMGMLRRCLLYLC